MGKSSYDAKAFNDIRALFQLVDVNGLIYICCAFAFVGESDERDMSR